MLGRTVEKIDYNAIEKLEGTVLTKVAYEQLTDMLRETDNRTPAVFGLKTCPPEFIAAGEIEVLENQLRSLLKHYKVAIKKKSPQSAWKPVYASLEAMTHYMQSKQAWITFPKELTRAETIFSAFGAAWVTMTETLTKAGTFSETSYPSVRRTMNATLTLGNEINERAGKIIHDWPAKLLAVYLNIDYIGDKKKKKPQNKGAEDGVSKKQSKKKKKDDAYSDDEEEVAKKKKHHHHHHSHANGKPVIEEPRDPWEFRDLVDVLKADRKRIGGVEFDLTMMTEDLRKLAVAAI